MRWLSQLRIRLQTFFRRGVAGARLDDELRFHLENQIAENTAAGMNAEEARYAALRTFGNPALLREQARATWSWNWLESFARDARFVALSIWRRPGFSLTVVGTLALGIGAAAAMFTVVDHVLLRPLPYRDAGRLVTMQETDGTARNWQAPWLDIEQWRAQSRSFSQVEFSGAMPGRNYLEGPNAALEIAGLRVSPGLFGMLGAAPALGNGFVNGDDAYLKTVTPDLQKIFGFHMAAGRFFSPQDTANAQPVIVVNKAYAVEHSPDPHNPLAILGYKVLSLIKGGPQMTIIGVIDDERQDKVAEPAVPEVDLALSQIPPQSGYYLVTETIGMDLAVRTERPTNEFIPELRTVLKQASPELQNATITTMNQIVEDSYGSQRLAAHLLEIFGGSALLLCMAGLYGLLAYVVSQRTRELGVRIALGASRGNLLWMVLRQAGVMLIAGVVAGMALTLASAKLVTRFLYGVSAHDGWTIVAAPSLLILTGLVAAYLPARRAANTDPMEALRAE